MIAAYEYGMGIYCPKCIGAELTPNGFNQASSFPSTEAMLDALAEAAGIDREGSFDSCDFPQVIERHWLTDEGLAWAQGRCSGCNEALA